MSNLNVCYTSLKKIYELQIGRKRYLTSLAISKMQIKTTMRATTHILEKVKLIF